MSIDITKSGDELKVLGNKAFAEQDFETAIEYYSAAIKKNPKNHVYFSNRSASYAGLLQFDHAIDDAKQCISLEPTFLKGYYRLATAQMSKEDWDGASQTIKQGLNVDPKNPQLGNLQQKLKQQKRRAAAAAAAASNKASSSYDSAPIGGNVPKLDAAATSELQDLQKQYFRTSKDYQLVQADLVRAQREKRAHEITREEVVQLQKDDTMYRSVGKMFLKSTKQQVEDYLTMSIQEQAKNEKDLTSKLEYLERRLKSQQQNMEELTSGGSK